MDFGLTDRCMDYQQRLLAFMDEEIYPAEPLYRQQMAEPATPTTTRPFSMTSRSGLARLAGRGTCFIRDPTCGVRDT